MLITRPTRLQQGHNFASKSGDVPTVRYAYGLQVRGPATAMWLSSPTDMAVTTRTELRDFIDGASFLPLAHYKDK